MITKELIDARWKLIIGGALMLVLGAAMTASYDWIQSLLGSLNTAQMPEAVRQQLGQGLGDYATYAWGQWFAKNAPMILGALAAFLGGGLIAGEVSKGTIFFLLSKPVSRTRVLLTKYGVAAGVLLVASLVSGLGMYLVALLQGHALAFGGVLLSAGLLWLGALSLLGLALVFSILFDDVLRPVALAMIIGVVVGLPGVIGAFAPGWADWSLPGYWASLSAFELSGFPGKALLITLVAAALPALAALPLFQRRAY